MINIKNVQVAGWEHAMRGMRQSFGSTRKGDTKKDRVGDKDFTLALRLAKSGPSHSKYLRFIQVWADITAPLYWWKQMDTYRFGKEQNSESTMHTITKRGAFHTDDFSTDGSDYTSAYLEGVIFSLNKLLNLYKDETDKDTKQEIWRGIIQILPESFNQTRTVNLNYQTLRNIYHQRKGHRLHEWYTFNKWIERLPYAELITELDSE